MNADYAKETGEAYVPQECEKYGFNETGGLIFDGTDWKDHCHGYKDTLDIEV